MMFDFRDQDFKELSIEAKKQGYELTKLYPSGEGTGCLFYRGYFGKKHNFAYARLSSIDRSSSAYKNLSYAHNEFKRYM